MPRFVEVLLNVPLNRAFTYANPDPAAILCGKRVEVRFGSRVMIGFAVKDTDALPDDFPVEESAIKPVLRTVDSQNLYDQAHIDLANWLSEYYLCARGEALAAMLPSGNKESAAPGMSLDDEDFSPNAVELSDEQQTAIAGILTPDRREPAYLYGLTGSGKTEVFLQAAEAVLASGKGVIYLVPEISLTHQVIEAVTGRFGGNAAVLHSGLTGNKKLAEWMRIRRGEAKIVVGARSAVFAPLPDLGLIIIDEEHDASYKSGNTPRYHARQVAMRRASATGAILVMGSATPSVEAWYHIKTGAIRSWRLTRRLSGGAEPTISVVAPGGSGGVLSPTLVNEIRSAKEEGRQSILFLNRRGFSHFYRCNTCGYEQKCRNCSVPLTWHRGQGTMKCHYCGWQVEPPTACPECGSLDSGYAGFGTEYIEDEVRRTFPTYAVQRVDTDTLTKKGELKKALDDFREGKTDLLLGTQMVAKGLNFPGVRLVGIALADTGLHMPDFRSSERTFALITQVAGRAGRFFPDGKVIIQTWNEKHPAIAYASRGDAEGFYETELAHRKELGFPPFARLVRLVFRSKNARVAEDGAEGAASLLRASLGSQAEILGPAECPISLIAGNHRHQLILRSGSVGQLTRAVRIFLDAWKPPSGLYIETDVDPVSLL